MKVAYVTSEYPPLPSGGIGTSMRHRARALVERGHDVWVVGVGADLETDDHGVRVAFEQTSHLPKLGWWSVRRRLQARLGALVADEGVEVVVAHDWLGLSAGVRPGCPILVECNGSATYFGALLDEPVRPSVRTAERWALRGADAVTAVSRFTAARTQELFGLRRACPVIPNAVQVGDYDDGAPPDGDLILWLGTLVRKKGILDLGLAFNEVVADHPDARLVVAGPDAPDRHRGAPSTWGLVHESLTPAARAQTDYLGPVSYDDVPALLARATVCVYPSKAEANPLTWIEAMAAGKPVVGYAHGWAQEVVESGVSGVLVPPGDIAALADAAGAYLADPVTAGAAGREARARAEARFSTATVIDQVVDAYAAAAGGS